MKTTRGDALMDSHAEVVGRVRRKTFLLDRFSFVSENFTDCVSIFC
jgi:hypothetical protein